MRENGSGVTTYLFFSYAYGEPFCLHTLAVEFHSWIRNFWHGLDSFQSLSDGLDESWQAVLEHMQENEVLVLFLQMQ